MEEVRPLTILLDINILLDVFLGREPWIEDSRNLWTAHHRRQIIGHVAAHGLTNLFYVARRHVGINKAREAVRLSLQTFAVVPVGHAELELADSYRGQDFEDNLVMACASVAGLDAIVTRDSGGFAGSPVDVLSPAELLERLSEGGET